MTASSRRFTLGALGLFLALTAAAAWTAPVRVIRHPDPAGPLGDRWTWASRQAAGADFSRGYWIGYAIRRRMPSNWFMGSWDSRRREDPRTLGQFLAGDPIPVLDAAAKDRAVRDAARKAIDEIEGREEPVRIVDKDIAFLFRFGPGPGRAAESIRFCDLALMFDPESRPVVWLGRAADADSVFLLERLFAGSGTEAFKKDLVEAVALHQAAPAVLPFLLRAAAPASPEAIRREAADALGGQNDPRAVAALKDLAERDRSPDVREDAVSALAESPVAASVDVLAGLASGASDRDVRRSAVEGLAEKAAELTVKDEASAGRDKDADVRREAVSALAEGSAKEALPHLIDLAKNSPDPVVRKAALEALGESEEPGAVTALVQILKNKKK
ncbi:MAG: HEAT repeat domain-containing protein [Acidobacteriota bacterium]|nr:HEAT repeat domain-containing protein [Acidobacteriota bacterium]